ncbi:acetate/propionate family kinase [Xanthobacter sediminis]|uniref:acetate/propionate family kinase n=1 Tax=Xanthobacter sediminis TaxID=3119926 RepID=UPI003728DAC9
MTDAILVVNSGSTSLKFAAYTADASVTLLCRGVVDGMATDPHFVAKQPDGKPIDAHEWGEGQVLHHRDALNYIITWLEQHEANIKVVSAGHRVVLGGTRFDGPARITPEVLDYLDGLAVMEPSHQAYNVRGARAIAEDFPGLPQVAVFDTSFHRTMPEVAQVYALPKAARDTGVRHWGYHGISYDYISRQVPKVAPGARRVVACHLGGGASVCAMLDGRSIETSMAFAGLTGLPMATRSGDVPADVIFYLLRTKAYTGETLEKALYGQSGLLGLSGTSSDMKVLQESGDPQAKLAVDYFVYALVKFIGAYTALLGGLDALVFTAGIGENSAVVRARVLERLEWLGLKLDPAANAANGPRITTADSTAAAFVIPTDEELMIARHTLALVPHV